MSTTLVPTPFSLVTSALTFVAGIAWNTAIQAAIDEYYPGDRDGIQAKVIYAIIVTLIVIVLSILLNKLEKIPVIQLKK